MAETYTDFEKRPSAVGGAVRGLFHGALKGGVVGALIVGVGAAAVVAGGLALLGLGGSALLPVAAIVAGIGGAALGSAGGSLGGAVVGAVSGHSDAREQAAVYDEQRGTSRAVSAQRAPAQYASEAESLPAASASETLPKPMIGPHTEALQRAQETISATKNGYAASVEQQREQAGSQQIG